MTGKHTPGPWAWFGNASSNQVYLATTHSGRRFIMDFVRWGMHGAQPRFQTERGVMIDAKDLLLFDVGDRDIVGIEAARKDTSVYRYDLRGINSANARLIAAAPDLLEALKALVSEEWSEMDDDDLAYEVSQGNQMVIPYIAARAAIAKATGETK